VTESLGTDFRVHHSLSRVWYSEDGTTQSVDTGREEIALHAERTYLPASPELLFFYCINPASMGGETTVCDGAALLEALDPQVRTECEAARLLWHTTITKESWKRSWTTVEDVHEWFEVEQAKGADSKATRHWFENDTLFVNYACPLLNQGWIGGRKAFANYLLLSQPGGPFATLVNGDPVPQSWTSALQRAADRVTTQMSWQRGDILVIDNTRSLHGRRAVNSSDRVIMVRMGDVNRELRAAG
jgi:alpha-ketoglutarate-dependent taurine dioxygenase